MKIKKRLYYRIAFFFLVFGLTELGFYVHGKVTPIQSTLFQNIGFYWIISGIYLISSLFPLLRVKARPELDKYQPSQYLRLGRKRGLMTSHHKSLKGTHEHVFLKKRWCSGCWGTGSGLLVGAVILWVKIWRISGIDFSIDTPTLWQGLYLTLTAFSILKYAFNYQKFLRFLSNAGLGLALSLYLTYRTATAHHIFGWLFSLTVIGLLILIRLKVGKIHHAHEIKVNYIDLIKKSAQLDPDLIDQYLKKTPRDGKSHQCN